MGRTSFPGGRLQTLAVHGQSVWLDYIHRAMLRSGELRKAIENDAVRGVTSNPTIFEQAIGQGDTYDEAIAQLAAAGKDSQAIYEALAMEDIRAACDQFAPIHEMSQAEDGYVSLEVSPLLARDAEQTVREARRLWAEVARPNVMIKIPGTLEGLPAVTQAISEGINVNVTLLFAVSTYERVIDAYLTGLERRREAGADLGGVRSVASFFVSRVDTECDRRLKAIASSTGDASLKARCEALLGKAAVANARVAYQSYLAAFEGQRFRTLMHDGANVQRPLWASTSTKNPDYPDTLYVDELIGPDTVNTMPPVTIRAFADHGRPVRTLDQNVDQARATLQEIEAVGVSMQDVTDFLVVDGVRKFADSFTSLIKVIEVRRARLLAAARA